MTHCLKIMYMDNGRWVVINKGKKYQIINSSSLDPDKDHHRLANIFLQDNGKAIFKGFF